MSRNNRAVQADEFSQRSRGVNTILRYMGLSPTDTNTYSSEHPPH